MQEVDPMIFRATHKYIHETCFVHTSENVELMTKQLAHTLMSEDMQYTLRKHAVWEHYGAIFHVSAD